MKCARPPLPASPVTPWVARSVRFHGSAGLWVQAYASRFGVTERHAWRDYVSACDRDGMVTDRAADRIAIFCGLHPANVWPEGWWAA